MANDRTGQHVTITGGMREFVGRTGRIMHKEMGMYRVRLDEAVEIPGVGLVRDDLWESKLLRTQRVPRPKRFRTAYGWAGGGQRS